MVKGGFTWWERGGKEGVDVADDKLVCIQEYYPRKFCEGPGLYLRVDLRGVDDGADDDDDNDDNDDNTNDIEHVKEEEEDGEEEEKEWRLMRGFCDDSAYLLPSLLFQNVFEG